MNEQVAVDIIKEGLTVALLMAAPVLIITMIVGVFLGILQAVMQLQEQTLVFIPKIFAAFLALIIFFPWMVQIISGFTLNLFSRIYLYIK